MAATETICPLCEVTFDDLHDVVPHLGAAHGLYDDEGTNSDEALAARAEVPAVPPAATVHAEDDDGTSLVDGIPVSRVYDPTVDDAKWRPAVIASLGVLLIGAVVLAFALAGSDGQPSSQASPTTTVPNSPESVAIVAEPTTTVTVAPEFSPTPSTTAPAPAPVVSPTTVRPRATPTTARAPTPPVTAAPPPPPAPPTTEAPPAAPVYLAPQATDARLDSCTRSGNDATWRFSYVLSGGSGWRPIPTATAAGGRLNEARAGLARDGFAVGSVQVVDDAGTVRTVALQPPLSADRCR